MGLMSIFLLVACWLPLTVLLGCSMGCCVGAWSEQWCFKKRLQHVRKKMLTHLTSIHIWQHPLVKPGVWDRTFVHSYDQINGDYIVAEYYKGMDFVQPYRVDNQQLVALIAEFVDQGYNSVPNPEEYARLYGFPTLQSPPPPPPQSH